MHLRGSVTGRLACLLSRASSVDLMTERNEEGFLKNLCRLLARNPLCLPLTFLGPVFELLGDLEKVDPDFDNGVAIPGPFGRPKHSGRYWRNLALHPRLFECFFSGISRQGQLASSLALGMLHLFDRLVLTSRIRTFPFGPSL